MGLDEENKQNRDEGQKNPQKQKSKHQGSQMDLSDIHTIFYPKIKVYKF